LTRKYGESIDEVLAWAEQSAARLLDLDSTDERIERLRTDQERLRGELATAAAALTAARTEAATRLSAEVTAELALLAMPDARLEITVTPKEPGTSGADEIAFLLAANTGSEPRPLHKGASG